ncbi:MAG TPA: FAD-dependent oxidoreductase [Gemmatimonadaceae bacterium]|jgi:protoporphyrinogen oxidase
MSARAQLHIEIQERRRMPNVGIVGGGMLGLTLAYRMRQRGYNVTLFESSHLPGGLAAPSAIGPFAYDRFPHVLLQSDGHLHDLVHEVGIADRLRWGLSRAGLYIGGRLHALSSPLDYRHFAALTPLDKIRVALTMRRVRHLRDGTSLESSGAVEWLVNWSGRRAYERYWMPLLNAVAGESHIDASAAIVRTLVQRLYGTSRTGHRRAVYGYLEGGAAGLLQTLGPLLGSLGVRLELSATVTRVVDDTHAASILLQDGRIANFDHVVVTTATPLTARLCPQLSDAERARLEGVTYNGIVALSVLLRKPLGAMYRTGIASSGMPFNAVVEATTLTTPNAFGGATLVYLPRFVAQHDSYWSLSDMALRHRFMAALGVMYPHLGRRDVIAWDIARSRHAIPVVTRNYTRDLLPALATSRPRIHLVNSAQCASGVLNLNDLVGLANAQSARLDERFAQMHSNGTRPVAVLADVSSEGRQ